MNTSNRKENTTHRALQLLNRTGRDSHRGGPLGQTAQLPTCTLCPYWSRRQEALSLADGSDCPSWPPDACCKTDRAVSDGTILQPSSQRGVSRSILSGMAPAVAPQAIWDSSTRLKVLQQNCSFVPVASYPLADLRLLQLCVYTYRNVSEMTIGQLSHSQ